MSKRCWGELGTDCVRAVPVPGHRNTRRRVIVGEFQPSHPAGSCGSGGHPAGRRAGRPARRKNAPRPGKVELFASPVETRTLDQAARCRQLRQAGRPPSPRLWRTGPPLQNSRSVPIAAIETGRCSGDGRTTRRFARFAGFPAIRRRVISPFSRAANLASCGRV
jgi:hypothetical protein